MWVYYLVIIIWVALSIAFTKDLSLLWMFIGFFSVLITSAIWRQKKREKREDNLNPMEIIVEPQH